MTDKTIDLDHSSRNGGSEIHGSPSTVGVALDWFSRRVLAWRLSRSIRGI
jgi:hypothetical protein